jgi:hypothetical protein
MKIEKKQKMKARDASRALDSEKKKKKKKKKRKKKGKKKNR